MVGFGARLLGTQSENADAIAESEPGMDIREYKKQCRQLGVIRRTSIEKTIKVLRRHEFVELAAFLEGKLKESPLEKPSTHQGKQDTDFFRFELDDNFYEVSDALYTVEAIGDEFGSEVLASYLVEEWIANSDRHH